MSFLRLLQRTSSACNLCRARGFASTAASHGEKAKSAAEGATPAATPLSSCGKDTVLTGVNYLKGQPSVLATADEEYPEWLWTILQPKVWPDDGPGGRAERVRRRVANKQRIKDRNFMSTQ